MKAGVLFLVSFVSTHCVFGQEHKFQIGASLGANISGSRDQYNMHDIDRQPQAGGSASAVLLYSMTPRFSLTGQLGGVVERFGTKRNTETTHIDYDWKYSWAEATGIVSYLPLVREKFDVFAGTGLTARRVLSATLNGLLSSTNGNFVEFTDYSVYGLTNTWNYLVPLQAGVNFHLESGGSILTSAEIQIGNRERNHVDNPAATNEKLCGFSLKAAYLIRI